MSSETNEPIRDLAWEIDQTLKYSLCAGSITPEAMRLLEAARRAADATRAATRIEVPCPDCYGGHFRPCQTCGDSGMVQYLPTPKSEEET